MSAKKRPITRKFWNYLKFLPRLIRAPLIRQYFKVPQNLPSDIILKQAETVDEITQALKMVYDAYLELDYIETNTSKMRLTKYHLLPTTILLVIVQNKEVLGTLSIIMDSSLKLPSDNTWNLSEYRKIGRQIAEISSLTIGKKVERRGQLLLPMCKLMYQYCKNILKLDGLVISTTIEVESFYTDVLLFDKVVEVTGQANPFVKGNPSTCCFLPLDGNSTEEKYKRIYDRKTDEFNLYKFFVKTISQNIELPTVQLCLQTYTQKQVEAFADILEKNPEIRLRLSDSDIRPIGNLDVNNVLKMSSGKDEIDFRLQRLEVRQKAKCIFLKTNTIFDCTLLNVSNSGFKVALDQNLKNEFNGESVLIFFAFRAQVFQFEGIVLWSEDGVIFGGRVLNTNFEWHDFYNEVASEVHRKVS